MKNWKDKLIAAVVSAYLLCTCGAVAHEWYPRECCGGQDCGDATVTPLENGNLLVSTVHGQVEVSANYKWRPSPDGRAHACIIKTGYGDALQCLWLPTGV